MSDPLVRESGKVNVWRVMRFETIDGKYCELASNHVKPDEIGVPPGYRLVSSTPMAPADECERLRAALELASSGLADASEALDILGAQVDASDAHQAHHKAREALEGPADAQA